MKFTLILFPAYSEFLSEERADAVVAGGGQRARRLETVTTAPPTRLTLAVGRLGEWNFGQDRCQAGASELLLRANTDGGIELLRVHYDSALDHRVNLPDVADVRRRIAVNQNHIRQLAGRDGS